MRQRTQGMKIFITSDDSSWKRNERMLWGNDDCYVFYDFFSQPYREMLLANPTKQTSKSFNSLTHNSPGCSRTFCWSNAPYCCWGYKWLLLANNFIMRWQMMTKVLSILFRCVWERKVPWWIIYSSNIPCWIQCIMRHAMNAGGKINFPTLWTTFVSFLFIIERLSLFFFHCGCQLYTNAW